MPNRSRNKLPGDFNQRARSIVDQATGVAPAKKAPRPVKKRDAAAVDQAEGEGMGQPQGLPAKKRRPAKKVEKAKDPAAVALGRKGGLKGGKVRCQDDEEQLSESAKKAAAARWRGNS